MSSDRFVILEIGNNAYGLTADVTIELQRFTEGGVTRMPHSPDSVMGVINHRGRIVPMLDMRTILGLSTLGEEIQNLRELLSAREKDHVMWLEELRRCCRSGDQFTKATDPHKCAFGQWFDGLKASEQKMNELTNGDLALTAVVNDFDEPHKRIHGIAEEALTLASDGKLDEAEAVIDRAWDRELNTMKRLFKRLMDLFSEQRRAMVVVIEFEGRRVGLTVDAIRSVEAIEDAAVEPVPDAGSQTPYLRGLVQETSEGMVLLLDHEAIIDSAVTSDDLTLAA